MISTKHLLFLLNLVLSGSGAAVPAVTDATVNPTAASTEFLYVAAPKISEPPDCQPKYCENGSEYCHYWGGVTGWDISLGPVPGMTRTSLGPCPTSAVGP